MVVEVIFGSSWGRGRKIICFGVIKYLVWVVVEVCIFLYYYEFMFFMMEGYVRNYV